jgi:hypothetical protein
MTYLPTDIMKNVLNYCDDRIEKKQKALWESIKVQRVFSIERRGSRHFVEDELFNYEPNYEINAMAFHFKGCKDKYGYVWDLDMIDNQEESAIYQCNINSFGRFMSPAGFPLENRYSGWIAEDVEFYLGMCKYFKRLIFKNGNDTEMFNDQDYEENYDDMALTDFTGSNVENIQDPDEVEEEYWENAYYDADPRYYWE